MSLTLRTAEYDSEVTVNGVPFYVGKEAMYFPVQKVLIISDDLRRWYDHLSPFGIKCSDKENSIMELEDMKYKAYDLSDHRQSWLGLEALYCQGHFDGKEDVRHVIRKGLGI